MAGAQLARSYAPPGSRISAAFNGGAPLSLDPYWDARLRQEQAEFERRRREISQQNRWMVDVALAPELAVAGLGLGAALGVRGLRDVVARYPKKPLDFPAPQKSLPRPVDAPTRHTYVSGPLDTAAKTKIREKGREVWAKAHGVEAGSLGAEVHHTPALQYAHITPHADPNRLSGLQAALPPYHQISTNAWANFARSLGGRMPTQAELMAAKMRIDPLLEPYIIRPGVTRSLPQIRKTPPRKP